MPSYSTVDEKARPSTLATEAAPLLEAKMSGFPTASFAGALTRPATQRLPQTIAHRGYKAAWPENTMGAFQGAVAVGAHAIETDVHLTRDKVVVLSHFRERGKERRFSALTTSLTTYGGKKDGSLVRCFGRKDKIADCDWEFLSTLRTTREPRSPMPRLLDLLTYLAQPGLEDIWVLIDIKRDDDPDELMHHIAKTFDAAPVSRPWRERIIIGCWDATFMRRSEQHLPGFPIAYIGWSLPYATALLRHEGVSFNLQQRVLVGPWGARFLRRARELGRAVFVWTVNDEEWMEWSVRKEVDGVITDDPKLFLDVCRRHDDHDGSGGGTDGDVTAAAAPKRKRTGLRRWIRLYGLVAVLQMLALAFVIVMRLRYGSDTKRVKKALGR